MKKFFFIGMFMLVSSSRIYGQKPLSVGDKCPDVPLRLAGMGKTRSLSNFKSWVIIDCWASWCTSCIAGFSKMSHLQEEFSDRLAVVAVDHMETDARVDRFIAERKKAGIKDLMQFSYDSPELRALFPRRSIPHYIWLDEHRVVRAITSADQVTAENLNMLMNNPGHNLRLKDDYIQFDPEKPFFLNGNGDKLPVMQRSTFTGYAEGGMMRQGRDVDSAGMYTRFYWINWTILDMLSELDQAYNYRDNRTIFNVRDTSALSPVRGDDSWLYSNAFCYELICSPVSRDSVTKLIKADLLRSKPYKTGLELRDTICYVIRRKAGANDLKSVTSAYEGNLAEADAPVYFARKTDMSELARFFNRNQGIAVLDESGYRKHFEVHFKNRRWDLKGIRSVLEPLGFSIEPERRKLSYWVIRDR